MIVFDLDGKQHTLNFRGLCKNEKNNSKSALHLKARKLLKEIFPTLQIIEEVPVVIDKDETLYLDFLIPMKKLCIEVQGEQHYSFSSFFHKNKLGFLKAKKRDNNKKEWCRINNIDMICLPYSESLEEWRNYFVNDENS